MPAPEDEAQPVMPTSEQEPEPVMAEPEAALEPEEAPEQALADPETTPAPTESAGLPFDLDALPVNPMYLVGGAGALLILLGVAALLRRRRAAADEAAADEIDDVESPEASSELEENLLEELEAVAADLSDEGVDDQRRQAPGRGSAVGLGPVAVERDPLDADPDSLTAEQIAELWKDEIDSARGRTVEAMPGANDGEPGEDIDIGELVDVADLAEERESGRARPDDVESGDLRRLFDDDDEPSAESRLFSSDSDEGDAAPFVRATASSGDVPKRPPGDGREMDDSVDFGAAAAELMRVDADRDATGHDDGKPELHPGLDEDLRNLTQSRDGLLQDLADDDEAGEFSLDGYGDDDVQTKIDLAQVYLEMDDTEQARSLLETVLTEGDAEQQGTARAMLSKIT